MKWNKTSALILMMNIYLFELFLTVVQGDIGDNVGGGWMVRNWVSSFPLLLLSVYRKAACLINRMWLFYPNCQYCLGDNEKSLCG